MSDTTGPECRDQSVCGWQCILSIAMDELVRLTPWILGHVQDAMAGPGLILLLMS